MNEKDTIQFTYGVYARKSSESEDRQVQSIERQIDDFLELREREKLDYHDEIIKESRSAFSTGREGFGRLIELTRSGSVNAWMCWHASRLSRNPIDAGAIIDLMDKGLLHHIRTPSRIYHNTPTDKMMLQIEFTMSKKDSDDKSVFVKSGLKKRYKKGLPNGKAPIGFLNDKTKDKGDRDWLVDRQRFDKLALVFQRFLKGEDSLNSITEYAREELHLTTPRTKKQGGKPVGRSLMEHILKNPIYAGFFHSKVETGNKRTLWKLTERLPRIITEEEHVQILNIFGERNRPNMQSHMTPYSGFIKGKDGNYIGADVKLQLICDCKKKFAYRSKDTCPSCGIRITDMRNPKYLSYTYYYNIKRKRTKGLSAKGIRESTINDALIDLFTDELQISEPFYEWSKLHLRELREKELENDRRLADLYKKELKSLDRKKERLRELFIEETISKEEFRHEIKKLQRLKSSSEKEHSYSENWYEHVNELLDTVFSFDEIIKKGSFSQKRSALKLLSPNLVWDEEKLLIYKEDWLKAFIEGRKKVLEKYPMFEPKNEVNLKGLKGVLDIRCPTLLGLLDNIRKMTCKK